MRILAVRFINVTIIRKAHQAEASNVVLMSKLMLYEV